MLKSLNLSNNTLVDVKFQNANGEYTKAEKSTGLESIKEKLQKKLGNTIEPLYFELSTNLAKFVRYNS